MRQDDEDTLGNDERFRLRNAFYSTLTDTEPSFLTVATP